MSGEYAADLYAALHTGTKGDEDFYRAVCAGADRVVELGCGSGRLLAVLADQVAELHGVDSSEEALRLARENVPASVELHRGDMETFEVGGDFDRVLIPFNGIYCLTDLDSVRRTFMQAGKALGQPVTANFQDTTPLKEVLGYLGGLAQVDMLVDRLALARAGLSADMPASLAVPLCG